MAELEQFDATPNYTDISSEQERSATQQALGETVLRLVESQPEPHTKTHNPHQMTRFRARYRSR